MIKVAYMLYNERPGAGLLKTQVVALLSEIAKSRDIKITIFSFWQPWVYTNNREQITELKNALKLRNIKLVSIPLAMPARHVFNHSILLDVSLIYVATILKFLKIFSGLNDYDVIHCRGYFISCSAIKAKLKGKYIFDMRSLYPEESISSGLWKSADSIYKKWKGIESDLIDKSHLVVTVSETMRQVVYDEYRIDKIVHIPISFDKNVIRRSEKTRNEIRESLSLGDKFVIVYAGSLEKGFWNDVTVYSRYFQWISEVIPNAYYLILTNSNKKVIEGELNNYKIKTYSIISCTPESISKWLSVADVGIQVMDKMSDSKTRFGVKTVEYLAVGLPIIINSNVGGAAKVIKDNNLGFIVDSSEEVASVKKLINNIGDYRERSIDFALANYEVSNVAKVYSKYYRELAVTI